MLVCLLHVLVATGASLAEADMICLGRGMASYRLVPGDIVVLQQGKATCDMVLLQGNCLVDESILSGEVSCHAHFPCHEHVHMLYNQDVLGHHWCLLIFSLCLVHSVVQLFSVLCCVYARLRLDH